MTTPWLRLFSAELTKAFRRSCERLTLRKAEWIHSATAPRNEQTTTPPISDFPEQVGIGGADIARRRKIIGQRPARLAPAQR